MQKSALYKSYTDFIDRFSEEQYVQDNLELEQQFFVDRSSYQEEFSYGLHGECNLSIECCIG